MPHEEDRDLLVEALLKVTGGSIRGVALIGAVVVGCLVALYFAYAFVKTQELSLWLAWGLAGGIGVLSGATIGVVALYKLEERSKRSS